MTPHGSDVLEIEVDGELPAASRIDGPSRPRRCAPAVASVVVGSVAALVVGAVFLVVTDGGAPTRSAVRHATPSAEDGVMASARAAMSAWGEFASTGDVGLLEGHFDASGPQYRQLALEAAGVKAARPTSGYEVECKGFVETLSGDRATVRASVTWRRGAEPEQQWEWFIDLRRTDAEWTVWTVRPT